MGRQFNGSSDTIYTAETGVDFERSDSFSVYAWVYLDSGSATRAFVAKADHASPNRGWGFFQHTANQLRLVLRNDVTTANHCIVNSVETFSLTAWHHVGFSYDGTSLASGVKLYIDGSLATNSVEADALSATILNNLNLYFGSRNGADLWFAGRLAWPGVHNVVLTLGEFKEAMRWGFTHRGKVRTLPFWGSSPEPDLSGSGNNGTLTGTTVAAHAPVGRYVPYRPKMPHGGPTVSALDVESITSAKNVLRWTDNSGGIYTTTIQRSTTNTTFTDLATVAAGVTTYTDTTPSAGTLYYYRIQSNN